MDNFHKSFGEVAIAFIVIAFIAIVTAYLWSEALWSVRIFLSIGCFAALWNFFHIVYESLKK